MKLTFKGTFDELKTKLPDLNGRWDISQPDKKVFRSGSGIMNWYENTGTIQFQGTEEGKKYLEQMVKPILYPDNFTNTENKTLALDTEEEANAVNQEKSSDNIAYEYLDGNFDYSEIIIGIVNAVGTKTTQVIDTLRNKLEGFNYHVEEIKVSSLLKNADKSYNNVNEYERIKSLMNIGDNLRKETDNNAILAYGSAKLIKEKRKEINYKKVAYIINSLKHPDEVEVLRKIYGQGFYLFGIHTDKDRRIDYLTNDKHLTTEQANELIDIDEDEKIPNGQRTRDTYHLSDFFIDFDKNDDKLRNTIQRFLELMFSHPYSNPTFDEFSMFMAFSSSVRSGDLSRQVGAVIAKNKQIIATGANECPASGGGHYWTEIDDEGKVIDKKDGKDFKRNKDSNKAEQSAIISGILDNIRKEVDDFNSAQIQKIQEILERSRISDLTEFGRVVHAEMEAILSCGRAGISCIDTTLYCTTFPCHNCAKHIIASGIKRVVYVEPYPKSKALEFHSDSIIMKSQNYEQDESKIIFEPFTGVGARRFLDFFSMNLGTGNKLKRKDKDGNVLDWDKKNAKSRVVLLPKSYLDIENQATDIFNHNS